MKVGYVVGSIGQVSTTFVNDLVQGLGQGLDDFFVLTQNLSNGIHFPGVRIRIHRILDRSFCHRLLAKIFPGLDRYWPSFTVGRRARNKFHQILKEEIPDMVLLDFGIHAVLLGASLSALGIPFVVHFHGMDITSLRAFPEYERKLQEVFTLAAGLIAASEHIRRLLILAGAPPEKIRLIRLSPKDAKATISAPPEKIPDSIVFVGRFVEKKHPLALVEAFRLVRMSIPSARLTLVGDGPLRGQVIARIKRHGLENCVDLPGPLRQEEALALMARHQVYAQHSVTAMNGDQEGFGLSLAEAALLELPVVSTRHNGIPEQVLDGETGLLCPEFDFETMAIHLIRLLQDKEMRQCLGAKGRQHILAMCQSRSRIQEIQALLLSHGAKGPSKQ